MSYSKLRGARKPKPKKPEVTPQETVEENVELEKDAFQEQGEKFIEKLVEHPYFLIGAVGGIVAIVLVAIFAFDKVEQANGENSTVYTKALKTWNAKIGEEEEFKSEKDKLKKAIKDFSKASSSLKL